MLPTDRNHDPPNETNDDHDTVDKEPPGGIGSVKGAYPDPKSSSPDDLSQGKQDVVASLPMTIETSGLPSFPIPVHTSSSSATHPIDEKVHRKAATAYQSKEDLRDTGRGGVWQASPDATETRFSNQSSRCRLEQPSKEIPHCPPDRMWQPTSLTDKHSGDVTRQQTYLLKVCRALMMYGAPTHRLEGYMHRTANVLEIPLQSFYMPGCMIISFSETFRNPADVQIVRCTQALHLAKLYAVRAVYKDVVHGRVNVVEATARIDEIMDRSNKFSPWFLVLMYGLASACIGPVSYGARPIDLPFIFLLGCLLGILELILATRSEVYAHVFEISSAILISFLARAFGSIHYQHDRTFCFSAICQASLVLILPGFTITTSALELQSKNIVSGSVRMVYGIIFTLFLAFGITIGSTIYGAIDSSATSATKCDTTWPFWWQIIFVPLFTLCYIIINQGPWAKMPAMVLISLAGWVVEHFSAQYFTASIQIAQALGALCIGIISNLSSRLFHDLAVALMHPAIFVQVPGSLAASGGLISGVTNADLLTHHNTNTTGPYGGANVTAADRGWQTHTAALDAGYSMVEIGIGITVGLSVSALVVYPFQRKKGKSGLFSY